MTDRRTIKGQSAKGAAITAGATPAEDDASTVSIQEQVMRRLEAQLSDSDLFGAQLAGEITQALQTNSGRTSKSILKMLAS
jgi:hypothetical protein